MSKLLISGILVTGFSVAVISLFGMAVLLAELVYSWFRPHRVGDTLKQIFGLGKD